MAFSVVRKSGILNDANFNLNLNPCKYDWRVKQSRKIKVVTLTLTRICKSVVHQVLLHGYSKLLSTLVPFNLNK